MKISLIVPTNRTSYASIARVFECASFDPDKFELIVRDNSEDEAKRALLREIRSPGLNLVTVPNRGAFENLVESLRLATGDFTFFLADDDWVSIRGLNQLHTLATQAVEDESVGSLTGTYLIETSLTGGLFRYGNIASPDPAERLTAYFDARGPNVLYYSAIRRSLALFCFDFLARLPYNFSYHDQLISMLYLSLGRTLQVDNVVYSYDLSEWETAEKTLLKDRAMYTSSGLPVEIDRLHWLLCGMEGGFLLNSQLLAEKGNYDRRQLADLWFANMFSRFKRFPREFGYAAGQVNEATRELKEKWISEETVNLGELLFDICDVLEKVDPKGAERYFKFWSGL